MTCSACAASVDGPSNAWASATLSRPHPIVTHGATIARPSSPTDRRGQAAAAARQLEEVELRRLVGHLLDEHRQHEHRQRAAPRGDRQAERDRAHREVGEVVGDLPPPGPRRRPLLEPAPPARRRERRHRVGDPHAGERRDPVALEVPEEPGQHERDPGERQREHERDQQPDRRGEEGDREAERRRRPAAAPSRCSRAPATAATDGSMAGTG